MDRQGTMLRSIVMALEQARTSGLKQIRVQTDFPMNELFIRKMVSKYKNYPAQKEPNRTKIMYCERIVNIMDEIEVILEYRKPRNDNRPGNDIFTLLDEDRQKGKGLTYKTSSDCTNSPNGAHIDGKAVPTAYSGSTVRTTGFGWGRFGIQASFHGIYWGKGDPRNMIEEKRNDTTDSKGRMLRSIMIALEQAMKSGLKRIRVQTDSNVNETNIRIMADKFKNCDLTTLMDIHLPKYGYCDRIVKIMDEIEVILEYVPAWNESSGNEVKSLLEKEAQNSLTSTVDLIPVGAPSLYGRSVPTAYVRGNGRNSFKILSRASLWDPVSIEHLDINQRPRGSIQRLSIYPATLLQLQMMAVLNAIKEAQSLDLQEIQVITDSLAFVDNFSRDWKDTNGRTAQNEKLYLEIKALTETIKVHFKGVGFSNDKLLKKVQEMAKEGLDYPVQNIM